jgi:hypothetical protein
MKQFRVLTTAALFGFGLMLGVSSSWAGPVTLPAIPAGASGLFFQPNFVFLTEPPGGDTTAEGSLTLEVPTPGNSGVVLELTDPVTGVVSDVITAGIDTNGSPALFLASDPFTTSGSLPSATATLTETGGWQDITSYFFQASPQEPRSRLAT